MRVPITILALLLSLSLAQNCDPFFDTDQFQTGSYTFIISPVSRRQCYSLKYDQSLANTPLQLGASISGVGNYQTSLYGIDYSLRSHVERQSLSLVFTLVIGNASWVTLDINYMLVGSRPDLIINNYIADTQDLLDCDREDETELTIPVPNRLPGLSARSVIGVIVFLSGIRTQSPAFNLQFIQPTYDFNFRQINVTAKSDSARPIQLLFLTYILMDLTSLSQDYVIDFSIAPQPGQFQFSGVVAMTPQILQPLQVAYVTMNKTHNLPCYGFECVQCQSISSCQGLGANVYQDKCMQCELNEEFIEENGCHCKTGYNLINGVCSTCLSGTSYDTVSATCVTICGPNQQWNGLRCDCAIGYHWMGGVCSQCPEGMTYNSIALTCVPICTHNFEVYISGLCVCRSGYTRANGVCVSIISSINCPSDKVPVNGACHCRSNYVEFMGSCLTCPANSYASLDQTRCLCNPGYTFSPTFTCVMVNQPTSITGINTSGSFGSQNTQSTQSTSSTITSTQTSSTSSQGSSSSSSSSNTGSQSSGISGIYIQPVEVINSGNSGSSSGESPITITGTITVEPVSSTKSQNIQTTASTQGSTNTVTSGGSNYVNYQCSAGDFWNGQGCEACSPYCVNCTSAQTCTRCSPEFMLTQNMKVQHFEIICSEICGDGIRVNSECDDNNKDNGDGCSSDCKIEDGWACVRSQSGQADECDPIIQVTPPSLTSEIIPLRNVFYINAFYQHVIVSDLPQALLINNCALCNSIIKAETLSAPAGTQVAVNFMEMLQNQQYHFVISLVLPQELEAVSDFELHLSLNPAYSGLFSQEDMNQKIRVLFVPDNVEVLEAVLPAQDKQGSQDVLNSLFNQADVLDEDESIPKEIRQAFKNDKPKENSEEAEKPSQEENN